MKQQIATGEPSEGVTRRDNFILCKGLAYAIETIEHLPDEWQEWSDKEDMIVLLRTLTADHEHCRLVARSHIERRGVKVVADQLELADRPTGQVLQGVF